MVPAEQAGISPYDHGFLYGDGVFEGIRIYNGRIFKLDAHLDRLFDSAKAIGLDVPITKKEFSQAIIILCQQNGLKETGYIRPVVTRGIGDLGVNPKKCLLPTIMIIAKSIALYPQQAYQTGLDVVIAETPRIPVRSLSPKVKSLNYLNNILAAMEANQVGAHEAIMLDQDGYIAECSADNFFVVFNGAVYTPTDRNCLKGVTRAVVKEICLRNGIRFHETDLHPKDLRTKADECFLTGTGAEIVPVVRIKRMPDSGGGLDELVIGDGKPGRVTNQLIEKFHEYVNVPENSTPIYTNS